MRLDKGMFDECGELAFESGMCHERDFDGQIGGWW